MDKKPGNEMENDEVAKNNEPSLVDEGAGTAYKNRHDMDTMEVLSKYKKDRGSAIWQHALSHVQFDEALLLQHLQRIETQHRQRSETTIEDSANTTGCNIPEVEKDALQMDAVAEVDNSAGTDIVGDLMSVSGAALAVAGGFATTPAGAAMVGVAGGVHGLLGTIWGKANPAVTITDVKKECTAMLNTQGEKIVALVNTKMVQVSNCVNELRGHVNKLFSGLIHFNLLSDEGRVQRGYAGIIMQLSGGTKDMTLIANAIDRNLGHCGAINNYQKWMEKEPGAKAELQKLLSVAHAWMKICEKLSMMFIAMLREKIPFTEQYVETVNIETAQGFVSFMDVVTKYHRGIQGYLYSAKNYRNYLYLLRTHRTKNPRKKAFPARQPRLGSKWHSRNGPFCRKEGTNRADNHRYTTNWGTWETKDSFANCVNTGGWYSKSKSRVDLYSKSDMDARRRRSYGCYGRECGRRSYNRYYGGYRGRGRLLETDSGTKGAQKEKHSSIDEDKFGKLNRDSMPTE